MNPLQYDRRRYAGIRSIRELERERRLLSVRLHEQEGRIGLGVRRILEHYSPARMFRSALASLSSGSLVLQFLSRIFESRTNRTHTRSARPRTTEKQPGKQPYENL